MTLNIDIRALTAKDKPAVMRILEATPEFTPAEVVIAEEVIDCYLSDPLRSGYYIIVAEIDREVAGYVAYGPTPLTVGTWDIYWASITRERQGQGIGSALISYAEDAIRKENGRLIMIETSSKPEYEKTRRFHHKMGYQVACVIKDFYAPGDDEVIFIKRFPPLADVSGK